MTVTVEEAHTMTKDERVAEVYISLNDELEKVIENAGNAIRSLIRIVGDVEVEVMYDSGIDHTVDNLKDLVFNIRWDEDLSVKESMLKSAISACLEGKGKYDSDS